MATNHDADELERASDAPGLYLHLPFCSSICPYCDFAVTRGDRHRRRGFVDALLEEIALGAPPRFPAGRFDTIYFGGGTPSLLDADDLGRILEALSDRLPLAPRPWLGLEANPEDVTPEAVAAWRDLGVDFLSLGVQSFRDDALAFLGRRHDGRTGRRAVELAVEAGFETVSVDLIYALPGQTAAAWEDELGRATTLGPHHLSCYQLTVEEKTPFGLRRRRGELTEMPEPAQARLLLRTHRRLAELGRTGYEVSNFAVAPRHRSRHNRKYWHHTPYLGLGPSAHSFDGRRRWWNERSETGWRSEIRTGRRPVAGTETLTDEQLLLERLLLGLRTLEGVSLDELESRYGVDFAVANRDRLLRLEREGKLKIDGSRVAPTRRGLVAADAIVRELTF